MAKKSLEAIVRRIVLKSHVVAFVAMCSPVLAVVSNDVFSVRNGTPLTSAKPSVRVDLPVKVSSPSYKKALEWYDYKEYGEALQKFHDALQEGWKPSEDDMVKIRDAFENRVKYLDDMIKKIEAQISIGQTPLRDPEVLRKERNDVIKWNDALKNAR